MAFSAMTYGDPRTSQWLNEKIGIGWASESRGHPNNLCFSLELANLCHFAQNASKTILGADTEPLSAKINVSCHAALRICKVSRLTINCLDSI